MSIESPLETVQSEEKPGNENVKNRPYDPLAEFQRLREETAGINAQMRASASLLNLNGSSSDALLGIILKELKAIRVEVKEVKEDVKRIEEDVKTIKKEQGNIQNDVIGNRESLMGMKVEIQSKLSKLKCHPKTIREGIVGKWKVMNPNSQQWVSFKIEGETIYQKWSAWSNYNEFTFGVKHSNGDTFQIENNKIIKTFPINGEEWKHEFFVKDGKLKIVETEPGKAGINFSFERIGDPDAE